MLSWMLNPLDLIQGQHDVFAKIMENIHDPLH